MITLNPIFRKDLSSLMNDHKPEDVDFYYGLIVTACDVMALVSTKNDPRPEIHPSDVNLLLNVSNRL